MPAYSNNMKKGLKVVLAILLFACLFEMPYGYYQLVRVVAMITFAYFGFKAFEEGDSGIGLTFLGLAILFQPLIKIALGRELWNLVDVLVGIWLVYLAATGKNKA